MCTLVSTHHRRPATRGIAAGAALVLVLALQTAAFGQPASPPAPLPVKQAMAPRQLGPWTLTGWTRGSNVSHCSVERSLQGGSSDGSALQFGFVRFGGGYRLVLSAAEWELTPQAKFPVELVAPPVLRTNTSAIAVAPKVVIVELGADGPMVRKLAALPSIEVKAAQSVFKLPLDGLAPAIDEVDTCFGKLQKPGSNPFAAAAPKPSAARKPGAAAPAKVTLVKATPVAPAATPATQSVDNDLVEERTFLTIPGSKGAYRLEALIVRPAHATGRLPIALITHGKNRTSAENMQIHAALMLPQARDFAMRGWLAVVVIRRGYGDSDGVPGMPASSAYMSCTNSNLVRGFDVEAEDLEAALKVVASRPDADGSRAIALGQSLGGGAVLALAARAPKGLITVVNVSGGIWRSNGDGQVCDHADLVAAMATFGSRTPIPTLWLYAQNDSLFPPELVVRMRDAYNQAGGRADLRTFPPVLYDGHRLFADFSARVKWLRALDGFLQANDMPNANLARADELMSAAKLPAGARRLVEDYLSSPTPKLLVVTASHRGAYWVANPDDPRGARKRLLTRCREKSGAECTVAMENNEVVLPVVTGAIEPEQAVH